MKAPDPISKEDTARVFRAYGIDYDPDKSLRDNWESVIALALKVSTPRR